MAEKTEMLAREFTVMDRFERRPAVDIAKEIIDEGDRYGAGAKNSTTILTRQTLEALVKQVEHLSARTAAASAEPVAWSWEELCWGDAYEERMSKVKPCWDVRNLQPLYAHPAPSAKEESRS